MSSLKSSKPNRTIEVRRDFPRIPAGSVEVLISEGSYHSAFNCSPRTIEESPDFIVQALDEQLDRFIAWSSGAARTAEMTPISNGRFGYAVHFKEPDGRLVHGAVFDRLTDAEQAMRRWIDSETI